MMTVTRKAWSISSAKKCSAERQQYQQVYEAKVTESNVD